MLTIGKYEIQQDNANCYRVIATDSNGVRRACDHPPCRSMADAMRFVAECRRADDIEEDERERDEIGNDD